MNKDLSDRFDIVVKVVKGIFSKKKRILPTFFLIKENLEVETIVCSFRNPTQKAVFYDKLMDKIVKCKCAAIIFSYEAWLHKEVKQDNETKDAFVNRVGCVSEREDKLECICFGFMDSMGKKDFQLLEIIRPKGKKVFLKEAVPEDVKAIELDFYKIYPWSHLINTDISSVH